MKYCPYCGKEVTEDQDVCLGCGRKLNNPTKVNKNVDPNAKSKIAAGLFGIFFGAFGVHNFYLGYTGKAVAQLILTITLIFSPVSIIWSFVEAIMILCGSINTDADGNSLVE